MGRTENDASERGQRYKNSISCGLLIPEIGYDPTSESDTTATATEKNMSRYRFWWLSVADATQRGELWTTEPMLE